MFASLMADLIAIDLGPAESLKLAARAGFVGIDLRINKCVDEIDRLNAESFAAAIDAAGLRPGYCSAAAMKMDVPDDVWRDHMRQIARVGSVAQALGYTRATSVVVPGSDELSFDENTDLHIRRTREAADALAPYGISFGLEYVSPLTRRKPLKHEFVHSLDGMLELLAEINRPNTGVMLDCFHWACARETRADINKLSADQVIAVHVNDLMPNVPIDEQTVGERSLPAEHGIIDIAEFLRGLADIGYQGPVTAEPTNPKWRSERGEDAARWTREAIEKSFDLAGIDTVRRVPNPTT